MVAADLRRESRPHCEVYGEKVGELAPLAGRTFFETHKIPFLTFCLRKRTCDNKSKSFRLSGLGSGSPGSPR